MFRFQIIRLWCFTDVMRLKNLLTWACPDGLRNDMRFGSSRFAFFEVAKQCPALLVLRTAGSAAR